MESRGDRGERGINSYGYQNLMNLAKSYRVLGIKGTEDLDKIKRVYKRFAHKYHPDKTQDNGESLKIFIDAKQAYEQILKHRSDTHD